MAPGRLATALLVAAAAPSAAGSALSWFDEKYACGVCLEILQGHSCDRFGSCGLVNASSAEGGCGQFCHPTALAASEQDDRPEVWVTKGLGTKPYEQVRVSVITSSPTPPSDGFFDHSSQFQAKWTGKYIHTAMKAVAPGGETQLQVLPDSAITVRLPWKGAGVAGALIADPCVNEGIMAWACKFSDTLKTSERVPALLNAFVADRSTDFWGIFGDNFYDRTGDITAKVMAQVSLEVKAKPFLTVAGNHDYWILGSPNYASALDQCGYGFMQYFAQDAVSAKASQPGSGDSPFAFDGASQPILGCNVPPIENFLWYNQIGNVAMIGQSGAYSLDQTRPFMEEACQWLSQQDGVQVAILFGHWDIENLGAQDGMDMPSWYTEMATVPGCAEFDSRHMLKFVMGHTHCNDPHPHGKVGAGFRVAGFGMDGCGNFGMPVVDTTDGRVRFWFFDTTTEDAYQAVINCVTQSGWRSCTNLATLWLDDPIVAKEKDVQVQI